MKKILLLILLSLFIIPVVYASPVSDHGKLTVKGTDIVDKNGNKYQLRGVSTHGIAWYPQYVNQDAFTYMRDSWGINVVRLAMYSNPLSGYGEESIAKVKEGVEYAKNAGLYVIIDWHILIDGNPNLYKEEALKFFKEMSELYKDYDNVIYEICNEPNGDVKWDIDVKPYALDVISAIRANDPDGIIVVGTTTYSQDVDIAANDPITGYDNIMYTFHFYAGTHKDNIRDKLKSAHEKGLPIFVTEFGTVNADGNGVVNTTASDVWLDLLDEYNTSYLIWNLSNKKEASSLIDSSVKKTTGWSYDELTSNGKYYVDRLKKYTNEENNNSSNNNNNNNNNGNNNNGTSTPPSNNNDNYITTTTKAKEVKEFIFVPSTGQQYIIFSTLGILLVGGGISCAYYLFKKH